MLYNVLVRENDTMERFHKTFSWPFAGKEQQVPTISDVAKRAEVSPATVSRVLQGAANVHPATRDKVERAIQEMGYVPSAVAQSLRSKRTRALALVVPDITNTFWTTVARGVEDVAQEQDYSVFLGNSDENPAKQRRYLDFLVSQQVDGVLIAPYASDATHLDRLRSRNIPTVILDRRIDGWDVDSVYADSLSGARALVQHLIGLGHRRIGMVSGPATTSTAEDRVAGYCMALTEARIPLDPELIQRGEYRSMSGEDLTHRLLDAKLGLTAIFAANNALAMGVIDALGKHGLRIPQDIALVCFDDLPNTSHLFPFLTVVAQPVYDMGVNAAQLVLSRLESKANLQPRHVVLPTRLIIRHSCGSQLAADGRCPLSLPLPANTPIQSVMVKSVSPDEQRDFSRCIPGVVVPTPRREGQLSDYDKSDVGRLLKVLRHQEVDRLPHLELHVTSRSVYEYVLERALEYDANDGRIRGQSIAPEDHVEFALRLGMDAVPCNLPGAAIPCSPGIAQVVTGSKQPASLAEQLTYLERYLRAAQGTHMGVIANLGSFFDAALRAACVDDVRDGFRHNRPLLDELMDFLVEQQERLMRVVCDRFAADLALVVVNDNIANADGVPIDPDLFAEVFGPRMQRLIAPAREHGKLLLLHTAGKIGGILPFLHDLGFAGVLPLPPEHNDLFEIKARWAGKLAFIGGFPTGLLVRGGKGEIEEKVREYCARLGPGGGYVLGSSGCITENTPPESLVTMTRAVHRYGRYGSLGQEAIR
jgi:LacI family transcriptional regulator